MTNDRMSAAQKPDGSNADRMRLIRRYRIRRYRYDGESYDSCLDPF